MTDLPRKAVRRLQRQDFTEWPIWTWVAEDGNGEEDESWVEATSHKVVPRDGFAQYLVASEASLKSGIAIPACVEVTVSRGKPSFAPLFVFLLDRHLPFLGHETIRSLSKYTKHAQNRPTHWSLSVPIQGEKRLRKGRVAGNLAMAAVSLLVDLMVKRGLSGRKGSGA